MVVIEKFSNKHIKNTFEMLYQSKILCDLICSQGVENFFKHKEIWKKRINDHYREDFAIIFNNAHIGNCGLNNICQHKKESDLYIYLSKQTRQKVGTQAMSQLLNYAFTKLKIDKVNAYTLTTNLRAEYFFKSLGFKIEKKINNYFKTNKGNLDAHKLSISKINNNKNLFDDNY